MIEYDDEYLSVLRQKVKATDAAIDEAIEDEEYERAARFRDDSQMLREYIELIEIYHKLKGK